MTELTDKEIIALFKQHKPTNVETLMAMGIKTEFIAKGISRNAYRVGQRLVVKFEYVLEWRQTETEVKTVRKIRRTPSFKHLRPHTMKVFYADIPNGVVLTKFYAKQNDSDYAEQSRLCEEFKNSVNVFDLHFNNFRVDEKGREVVIDLGYVCAKR